MKSRQAARVRRRPEAKEEINVALTLHYWREGPWYVGEITEAPDVFSQGRTLPELRRNIREARNLMLKERPAKLPRQRS